MYVNPSVKGKRLRPITWRPNTLLSRHRHRLLKYTLKGLRPTLYQEGMRLVQVDVFKIPHRSHINPNPWIHVRHAFPRNLGDGKAKTGWSLNCCAECALGSIVGWRPVRANSNPVGVEGVC